MTAPGVGEVGSANASPYRAAAEAVLAAHPKLDEFVAQLDAALPGTNTNAAKILCYDKAGALLDKRTALGQAAYDADTYAVRRDAFQDLWRDGRRFIYFAPNPGTLGAIGYGAYCLIVNPAALDPADTGVFPKDSAQHYTAPPNAVFADEAYEEVGDWDMRADVALVHHGPDAAPMSPDQRAKLICGEDTYMEVVTVGPVPLDRVETLRVTQRFWDESDDLWWKWKAGGLTAPEDRAKAKAYEALIGWPTLNVDIR